MVIQPISPSGQGPKSNEKITQSWSQSGANVTIHLLSSFKVQSKNLLGQTIEDVKLQDYYTRLDIGPSGPNFILYNSSHILYNGMMIFEDISIESVIYEPYAQSLYINLPNQKRVIRRPLNGPNWPNGPNGPNGPYDIYSMRGAEKIQFDSISAHLCWIEYQKAIKCIQLPYEENSTYIYKVEPFTESTIQEISFDNEVLYFIVQEAHKYQSVLYQHDFRNRETKSIFAFEDIFEGMLSISSL